MNACKPHCERLDSSGVCPKCGSVWKDGEWKGMNMTKPKRTRTMSNAEQSLGYAALRADIESQLSEARDLMRRCMKYFPKQNYDHIAAEISALKGLLERDDSRMKAPQNDEAHPLPGDKAQ